MRALIGAVFKGRRAETQSRRAAAGIERNQVPVKSARSVLNGAEWIGPRAAAAQRERRFNTAANEIDASCRDNEAQAAIESRAARDARRSTLAFLYFVCVSWRSVAFNLFISAHGNVYLEGIE